MPTILNELNWLDLFYVILLLGMIYKGTVTGVGGQIIPLAGSCVIVYISIHYYSYFSEAMFGFLLQKWAKPISFAIISVGILLVVKFIAKLFSVVRAPEIAFIERIGGVIIAAFRSFILFGLLGLALLLVPVEQVKDLVVNKSASAMFFVKLDAQIFDWISHVVTPEEPMKRDQVLDEFVNSIDRQEYKQNHKKEPEKVKDEA